MRKTLSVAILISLFACSLFAYEVVDASGKRFEFASKPNVATVVPSLSQIIFMIGSQDNLLGNSRYCNYPEGANAKVKLGGLIDPDYERIATLKPDLFLLPDVPTGRNVASRLKKLSVETFMFYGDGLESISQNVRLMGQLLGNVKAAECLSERFEKKINEARIKSIGKGQKSLFMFGRMAAGKGSFAGDLLDACGLKNCASVSNSVWPLLSKEFIITSAPEILFVAIAPNDSQEELLAKYKKDSAWAATPAVKNNRVYFIPRDLIEIPTPRILEVLDIIQSKLD